MKPKIALIISHPIQHFCPQYVSFARQDTIQFKVFFASMLGYKTYFDPNFGKHIEWGNLELDKFEHEFLNGEAVIPADKYIDAPNLEERLEAYAPDCVITYGYFQRLQRRAYKWCKKKQISIAYIADSERKQLRNRLMEWIKYPWLKQYLSRIDFFLTVGDANEDYYRFYGVNEKRFIRMHFPIDVQQYEAAYRNKTELREYVRNQYGIAPQEKVACVVGKLVPWKNQTHIIEAMKLLERQNIHMHLFILGSGLEMEALKANAATLQKSKVYFPGFVKIEDLPAFYAASDFYIHPASIEPHSIAISEAIFMGCPVIVSDRTGSFGENDDVEEGMNGYVYPFGDIDALSTRIKSLICFPEESKKMSEYSHALGAKFQRISHHDVIYELTHRLGK